LIQINKLKFSNVFSYGQDNFIDFGARVTQLVGENGAGKSSIPTILEECLYNKNSRGIKKSDIQNRYSGVKTYSIEVAFTILNDSYVVSKTVTSSSKVTVTKNDVDVSGHTATQTYKNIEQVLGMEFSTFTKLVYQSMISSLDFLSATDANRKKFLVSLLGLESYVEAEKVIKEAYKTTKSELAAIKSSVETVRSWVEKNNVIPQMQQPIPVPAEDSTTEQLIIDRKAELSNISLHNTIATENIRAIKAYADVSGLKFTPCLYDPEELVGARKTLSDHKVESAKLTAIKTRATADLKTVNDIKENCHACGSKLEVGNKEEMISSAQAALDVATLPTLSLPTSLLEYTKLVTSLELSEEEYKSYVKYLDKLEVAEAALDSTKPIDLLDKQVLTDSILEIQKEITSNKLNISKAIEYNNTVQANNSTIQYQTDQLIKFEYELNEKMAELGNIQVTNARMEVLAAALGSKGLIAYKIESMVKVFESLINKYLQVLADGRFALGFSVEDTKLALKLYDSGEEIDIKSLSSGEFNRVNTATLLAVRKMMTSISKVDINLLFLDEVVSVLDQTGKDTLIEVLLKEKNLNSIVVSHGYTHPLADKIIVTKEQKISRLDR
jgi:DNA repair exonuclease SbcCD ATPase subunit